MQKTSKRLAWLILLLCVVCCLATHASALSGECGDGVVWTLNNNKLSIEGQGTVDNSDGWIDYCDVITEIVVSEGVNEIGSYVFADCSIVTSVKLPTTLNKIGSRAFANCNSLNKLFIPESVTVINRTAFYNCDNINIICIAGSYAEQFAKSNSISYTIMQDVSLSFDANGGESAPDSLSGSITDTFTIPEKIPNKDGYIFIGWSKSGSATSVEFYPRDELTIDKDTILYAVWFKCYFTDESTENNVYIEANADSPRLFLYKIAYRNKCLVAISQKEVELSAGKNNITVNDDWGNIDKDEIKIFLWDGELRPYTSSKNIVVNKLHTVTFVDWDNKTIDTQLVSTGNNAILPTEPTRDGYEFCGWAGNYKNVSDDEVIVAQYIDSSKDNVFKVSSLFGKEGETVTLSVNLGGIVETCGFDMRMCYDTDALELVKIDADWNLDIVANSVPEEGVIKFNYGSSKNRTKKAKIMEVTFKIKNSGLSTTTVSLIPVEVVAVNASQNDEPIKTTYTLIDGVVTIQ